MADALARTPTLGESIADCIRKHGRATLYSHPDDAGVIPCDKETQRAIEFLVAEGKLEILESRFVDPGNVLVAAPFNLNYARLSSPDFGAAERMDFRVDLRAKWPLRPSVVVPFDFGEDERHRLRARLVEVLRARIEESVDG